MQPLEKYIWLRLFGLERLRRSRMRICEYATDHNNIKICLFDPVGLWCSDFCHKI